jgi:hypothetical protein
MKRRAVLVGGLLLTTLALAGTAAASCNPGRSNASGNWHDGWDVSPPTGTCLNGSSAYILVYSAYVAADDDSAWAMQFNAATLKYGQVGWIQQANGSRYDFTESSTVNGGFQQRLLSASSIGSAPQYKVTFSGNAFHYFIDGTNVDTDANTGYTGCWAEQEGEVRNSANQMPGGYNSHVSFTTAQVRRADTQAWFNADGTLTSDNDSWYGHSKVSSSQLDIWDKACAS